VKQAPQELQSVPDDARCNFDRSAGRLSGADMSHRVQSIAAFALGSLAGAAVATLVLVVERPADAGHRMGSGQHDHGAVPPRDSPPEGGAEPTFYSELSQVNTRMHEGMEIAPGGNIDRDFMRMMIPHHEGAVDMARVLLKYGHDERLKRLAQSIIVEQGQEIAYMRTLLDAPQAKSLDTDRIADK
jgi:hypothetical protein